MKSIPSNIFRLTIERLNFLPLYISLKKYLRGYQINPSPQMPESQIDKFTKIVKSRKVRFYLEYGSGGSTILGAKLGIDKIITVETDKVFLDAVLSHLKDYKGIVPLHSNIGLTTSYGYPLFGLKKKRHFSYCAPFFVSKKKWEKHASLPWDFINKKYPGESPDLILIDGRFRVASVLMSLMNLKGDSTILILDDYREHYRGIEPYIDNIEWIEKRSICFTRKLDFDKDACLNDYNIYKYDPR